MLRVKLIQPNDQKKESPEMFKITIAVASNNEMIIFHVGTSPSIIQVNTPNVNVASPNPIGLIAQ